MFITKYGKSTVYFFTIVSAIILIFSLLFLTGSIKTFLIIFSFSIELSVLFFFRDFNQNNNLNKNHILSPCYGTVISIDNIYENKFLNSEAKSVSIFLSFFDIHVNTIPISGVVKFIEYIPGSFSPAFLKKKSDSNEKNLVGIETEHGKILFSQVSGIIVRRIVCELSLEQNVTQGNKFGMIKFGSRMDIIVPNKFDVVVKKGNYVKAGQTIIYELR